VIAAADIHGIHGVVLVVPMRETNDLPYQILQTTSQATIDLDRDGYQARAG